MKEKIKTLVKELDDILQKEYEQSEKRPARSITVADYLQRAVWDLKRAINYIEEDDEGNDALIDKET